MSLTSRIRPRYSLLLMPGVDAGAAALEAIRVHARVLERAPAGLQHQPLLRVQHLRLHRRDAEEGGVEVLEIVQVGAEAACPHLPRSIGEEQSHAPDSGAGLAFRHGAPALVQQAPEGGEIVRAGKSGRPCRRSRSPRRRWKRAALALPLRSTPLHGDRGEMSRSIIDLFPFQVGRSGLLLVHRGCAASPSGSGAQLYSAPAHGVMPLRRARRWEPRPKRIRLGA